MKSTAQSTDSYYASHLSEVDKTNSVISTENIYSTKGILLVKKGARVNSNLAEKLLQHKLLRPIEEQVDVENTLRPSDIINRLNLVFKKYPDIGIINDKHEFYSTLVNIFKKIKIDTILIQKLTVLSIRLPDVFEKSLFCAWLSALISQKMNLDNNRIDDAFIAGLFHDIGLLHIDPKILFKKGQLSSEEWRAIQSHVIIGHLIFKQANTYTDMDTVAMAILEHHECSDGTGYPKGLLGNQLNMLGKILGMADTLQAIRTNRLTADGQNLRNALPILHMNSNKHHLLIYKAMCLIILNSHLPMSLNYVEDSLADLAKKLLVRVDILQDAIVVLRLISYLIQQKTSSLPYKKLLAVITPVTKMIISSGMVNDELIIWLKGLILHDDPSATHDLLEMKLMQSELLWQLKNVIRVVNDYLDKSKILNAFQKTHLKKLSDYIAKSTET